MGLVDRINAEVRAIGGVPWQPWANPYWRFNIGGPVHPSRQVQGIDACLGLAAVYSCIRFIADAVASLPINVYRTGRDGNPILVPHSQFLDQPSTQMNPYEWIFAGTASALAYGNSIGLIVSRTGVTNPDGLGYPQDVDWLPMDRISIQDDEHQPWNSRRAKVYFDGQLLNREDMLHLRAFVLPGRLEAISPILAFATLIQQGLDSLRYSATWFENGGFPLGTFTNSEEEVDVQSAKEIRQNLTDTLRQHQPLVYGRNWEYKAVTVPPNEAAFIQAMQLNATQVAAIYGMPPSKVGGTRGDSLTYATQEQETLSIITDTLRPWLRRWEVLLSSCLPATQYVRFDTDALLKTDLKTRYEIFQTQRNMGIRTTDELRASDDLPPLPRGAGKGVIPLSMLERMATTTRTLPKAYMNEVVLEQALIANLMVKLQKEGYVPPDDIPDNQAVTAPGSSPKGASAGSDPVPRNNDGAGGEPGSYPIALTPPEYLGRQITAIRSAPSGFTPPHVRCSNVERARACDWIAMAHRVGCLDEEEMIRRTESAKAALKRGMLGELTGDLPPEAELRAETLRLAEPDEQVHEGPRSFAPLSLAQLRERARRWESEPSPNGSH